MAKSSFPQSCGRYQLVKRIAVGGMAEIFHAKVVGALGFEKNLIIKRVLPELAENPEFLRMFATEASLVCHLEHPNIVQVLEFGEADGVYFLAMEYVHGLDARLLWRALAKHGRRLPLALALHVVAELLKGLDYAHQAVGPDGCPLGVVHRDVSLSNVLISYLGEVKIGDFGVALVKQESRSQAGLKGKYGYMSPEQLAGLPVDHRTDIFSSGVALAELMMGRRLFRAETDFETIHNIMNMRLDLLDQHEELFPCEVMAIVRRALQRRVEDRYQTAGELYEEIAAYLHALDAQVSSRTLSAFIAAHVAPYLAKEGEQAGGRSELVPPEPDEITETTTSDLTPSFEEETQDLKVPLRERAVAPEICPDQLAPIGALLDGSEEGSPRSASAAPVDLNSTGSHAALAEPAREGVRGHHEPLGEIELAPSEEEEVLLTEHEAKAAEKVAEAARLAAILGDGPAAGKKREAPQRVSPASTVSLLLSRQLRSALDPDGPPDAEGDLEAVTLTKVIFGCLTERETGLLVASGPAFSGKQATLLDQITHLQRESSATTDARPPARRTCQIHFDRGVPDLVSADCNEETLVAYLARVGVLGMDAIAGAIRGHPELQLIEALVAKNCLMPFHVTRHVTSFTMWSVFSAFSWSQGNVLYYRERGCMDAFPTGYHGFELIPKGISYIEEPVLQRHFEQLDSYMISATARPRVSIEQLDPSPLATATWDALHTAQPVDAAVAICSTLAGDRLRGLRTLYMMIECEMAMLFE